MHNETSVGRVTQLGHMGIPPSEVSYPYISHSEEVKHFKYCILSKHSKFIFIFDKLSRTIEGGVSLMVTPFGDKCPKTFKSRRCAASNMLHVVQQWNCNDNFNYTDMSHRHGSQRHDLQTGYERRTMEFPFKTYISEIGIQMFIMGYMAREVLMGYWAR